MGRNDISKSQPFSNPTYHAHHQQAVPTGIDDLIDAPPSYEISQEQSTYGGPSSAPTAGATTIYTPRSSTASSEGSRAAGEEAPLQRHGQEQQKGPPRPDHGGYQPSEPMNPKPLLGVMDPAKKAELENAPGCCFSSTGGCCFSSYGGCCFSKNGACCFSDNGACCFSNHGGCCFGDHGGACCSGNGGCC